MAREADRQRPAAAAVQRTPEGRSGAEAFPEPPEDEDADGAIRLGSDNMGEANTPCGGVRPSSPCRAAAAPQQSGKRRRLAEGPTEGQSAAAAAAVHVSPESSQGEASDDDLAGRMVACGENQPPLLHRGGRGDGGAGSSSSGLGGSHRARAAPPREAGGGSEMEGSFAVAESPPEEEGQPSEPRKRRLEEEHPQTDSHAKRMRRLAGREMDVEPAEPGEREGRALCGGETTVQRRQFGRRYLGVSGDPVDAADSRGHALLVTGPMIWCGRCGRYALKRLGKALKTECPGVADGVYVSRLTRLRNGLHPITGKDLV